MENFISEYYDNCHILTPDDGAHYFFGYYDMRATGESGKHLCHRVSFMDRMQEADDVCELGYLDDGHFFKFAETTAWNFQQGALLQWHGDGEVMYNVRTEKGYGTEIRSIDGKLIRQFDMPLATASDISKTGISVNFERIYDTV